jgi:hypothetical protein
MHFQIKVDNLYRSIYLMGGLQLFYLIHYEVNKNVEFIRVGYFIEL